MEKSLIEQRHIGCSSLTTSSIAFGTGTFGREIDEEASYKVLDYAIEKGITFFDSAESYGGGDSFVYRKQKYGTDDIREVSTEMHSSEKIIGRWLKKRNCRKNIVICTKVSSGNTPENIHKQVEASCERLGISCIDVYMLHSPTLQVPIEESLDALNEEIESGKIKVIGCSNFSAEQMQNALEVSERKSYARFEVIQPPYSLANRSAEAELFPLCRHKGIAIISYSPLAAGFLAGKYTPDRSKFPKGSRFDIKPGHADIYFNEHNFEIVEKLRQKSEQLNIPMVRLAMAWAMAQPAITAVLVGARSTEHIDNALSAAQMNLDFRLRREMSGW